MRIVKPGVPQFNLWGSCHKCKCEVEADYGDPDVQVYKDTEEWSCRPIDRYKCECPTERCGMTIYLRENKT